MPVEAKPLFRPDVLRTHLAAFQLPERAAALAPKLNHWAETPGRAVEDSHAVPGLAGHAAHGMANRRQP